jgi:hypothetical protein
MAERDPNRPFIAGSSEKSWVRPLSPAAERLVADPLNGGFAIPISCPAGARTGLPAEPGSPYGSRNRPDINVAPMED